MSSKNPSITSRGHVQPSVWKAIWRFFSRCFVLAGLPLIAWGLDDLGGFLANPARLGFILIVATQAFILAWLGYTEPPEPGSTQDWRSILGHFHADLFEFINIMIAFNDRRSMLTMPENFLLRSVGVAVFLVGTLLSLSASFTWVNHLKKESIAEMDHPVLLNTGLYRWIRYPKMLALLLDCVGAVFIFRSWAGLVLLIPEFASILNQVNVMERVFSSQYQKVWYARCQTSKKLLPFIF